MEKKREHLQQAFAHCPELFVTVSLNVTLTTYMYVCSNSGNKRFLKSSRSHDVLLWPNGYDNGLMILLPTVVCSNPSHLNCKFAHICYLVDGGIVSCAIHCIMHVHSPQGDQITIRMCPNNIIQLYYCMTVWLQIQTWPKPYISVYLFKNIRPLCKGFESKQLYTYKW